MLGTVHEFGKRCDICVAQLAHNLVPGPHATRVMSEPRPRLKRLLRIYENERTSGFACFEGKTVGPCDIFVHGLVARELTQPEVGDPAGVVNSVH